MAQKVARLGFGIVLALCACSHSQPPRHHWSKESVSGFMAGCRMASRGNSQACSCILIHLEERFRAMSDVTPSDEAEAARSC